MLIAAKPTPSVMPTKNLPSRVNFRRRGGRNQRRSRASANRAGAGGPDSGAFGGGLGRTTGITPGLSGTGAEGVQRPRFGHPHASAQSGTGTRATMSRIAASASSRVGSVAVGVGGEADAMREHGHREVVDVVGDAVVAAAEQRARASGARQVHAGARATRRARAPGSCASR